MDTALQDGDFLRNSLGMPRTVDGLEELLQRAMIRMRVPKGAFSYDPELGSGLSGLDFSAADAAVYALELTAAALAPMEGVTVESVSCSGRTVTAVLNTPLGQGRVSVEFEKGTLEHGYV